MNFNKFKIFPEDLKFDEEQIENKYKGGLCITWDNTGNIEDYNFDKTPLHIILVLDTSSSMSEYLERDKDTSIYEFMEPKICISSDAIKEALISIDIIRKSQERDIFLTFITFNNKSTIHFRVQKISGRKNVLKYINYIYSYYPLCI